MPAITTLPNQPATRNDVASTMPQKPSSGSPTADAKSSTFHAIQKSRGPRRSAVTSARSATASPPATRAPNPSTRSTRRKTGLTGRVYGARCCRRGPAGRSSVAEDGGIVSGPLPHGRRAGDLHVADLLVICEPASVETDRAEPEFPAAIGELLEQPPTNQKNPERVLWEAIFALLRECGVEPLEKYQPLIHTLRAAHLLFGIDEPPNAGSVGYAKSEFLKQEASSGEQPSLD